jgi:hypothetical protein
MKTDPLERALIFRVPLPLTGLVGALTIFSAALATGPNDPCRPPLESLAADPSPASASEALYAAAVAFSEEAHRGETWLHGHPYAEHYRQVEQVLADFGFGPDGSARRWELNAAARLHDVVEKTPTSLETIRQRFGDRIALIVDGTTPIDPADPSNEAQVREAKKKYFEKTNRSPDAVLIKLADRIANFASYLRDGIVPERYRHQDHADFRAALYRPGEAEPLWRALQYLVDHAPELAEKRTVPDLRAL